MTRLRLLLGDQLNYEHSWFAEVEPNVVYLMMEVRQETDYVLHHAQKVIAIFAAMRHFAETLRKAGHRVLYLTISAPQNLQGFAANLGWIIPELGATALEWQSPDEYRLDQQFKAFNQQLTIPCREVDSEHFYTQRHEVERLFTGKSRWLMENFYRTMRKRHGILLDSQGEPLGGRWNFDAENRQSWKGSPPEPDDNRPCHNHSALWAEIQQAGIKTLGQPEAQSFRWPVSRGEAKAQLADFIQHALPHFGPFQDAISLKGSRLFHSLLSFALNVKLLHPSEVVAAAEAAYRENHAPLAAVEGFIRQVIGWREYIRGVYWAKMPNYGQLNYFGNDRPLPPWYWTGQTRMRCLSHAIGQSLDMAYAHHIQRLMLTGNFALLAGISPEALHRWYLGIYIDAFEWVEMPNTLGMSQYADGGLLATKPYVSSAAYIQRMGDTCKGCHYDAKARLGPKACPFNALYWDFHLRHETQLTHNPRIGMVYKTLARMPPPEKEAIRNQATIWLEGIEEL